MIDVAPTTPLIEAIARISHIEFQVYRNGKRLLRTTVVSTGSDEAETVELLSRLTCNEDPFHRKIQANGMTVCGVPLDGTKAPPVWLIALMPALPINKHQEDIMPLIETIARTLENIQSDRLEINELAAALNHSFEELALYRRIQDLSITGQHASSELSAIFNRLLYILDADLAFGHFPECSDLNHSVSSNQMREWGDPGQFTQTLVRAIVDGNASTQDPFVMINNSSEDPKFSHLHRHNFRLLACRAAHNSQTYGWIGVVSFNFDTFFKHSDLNMLRTIVSHGGWMAANNRLIHGLEALTQRVIDFRHDLKTHSEKAVCKSNPNDLQPGNFLNTAFNELAQKIETTKTLMIRNVQMATVGQMAAVFAHEIKQPLCALDGLIQIAQMETNAQDQKNTIKLMAKAVRNMGHTIKRFESFSKPSQQTRKPISLNIIAKEIYQLVKPQLDFRQISAHLDRASDLSDIIGDAQSLQQAGLNLVTNAIQAMESDDGHPFELKIKTYHESGKACLSVIDNGCGFPEHLNQKVVEPYFTTKPHDKGTGLGLAVVADIIEQHNGQLEIESAPGKGSQFTLKIPMTDNQSL